MGGRLAWASAVAAAVAVGVACGGQTAIQGGDAGTGSSGSSGGSASGSGGSSGGSSSGSTSSSGSGSSSGPTGSDSSSGSPPPPCMQCGAVCVYPDCGGGCASVPPASAMRAVSLSLTGVSIDGGTPSGWKTIGFNLDGKCTVPVSTNVCTLQTGASKATQADGSGGIDNSYGENICPIAASVSGSGACSSGIQNVYVITDATGTGTMAIPTNGQWLEFPIHDTFVAQMGNQGVLGAVAPTMGVISAYQAVAGSISPSLCSGSAFQSIAQQIEEASDIQANGSDTPGLPCDSISIGMTFTGSTPYAGPLPVVNNPCVSDAGAD